jgi:threonine aldolase
MDTGQAIILNIPIQISDVLKFINIKKMKIVIILFIFSFLSAATYAQSDHATQLANKIAQKMKDSLGLTGQQKNSIVDISMNLHEQKSLARQQHHGSDSLRYFLQRIENTRDTLYSAVLSQQQYLLYKQKKRNLVNNN